MKTGDLKRTLFAGTVTGYAVIATRMLVGLVTFRVLYQGLSAEEFGFWSLLWAIIGFGIVVDFGFGYSVRKRVAEHSAKQEWQELSEVLSTVLGAYALSACLIFAVGALFSWPLMEVFQVSPQNQAEYRLVFLTFLGGSAILFPLGIFPEVLNGQQRLVLLNLLGIGGTLLNLTVVASVVWLDLGLTILVVGALGIAMLGSIVAAVLGMQRMPQVRIGPRYFSMKALRETSKFSVFAYLNTLSVVADQKAAQPAVSSVFGVATLPPFQAGAKLGELVGLMMQQIGKVLSPTAAHLHATGDVDSLRKMLLKGIRFNSLLGALMCIPTCAYIEGILRITTGEETPSMAMVATGLFYIAALYSKSITHTVYIEIYMMAGRERHLMLQGVCETLVSLAAGVGAMLYLRGQVPDTLAAVGMGFGTLFASTLVGWLLMWTWVGHAAGTSRTRVFLTAVLPTWVGALPMVLAIAALRYQPFWQSGGTTVSTLAEGTVVGLIGIAGMWKWTLTPQEREWFSHLLSKRVLRR